MAAGIRQAYAPLFASDEAANALSPEKLKGLIAQVAGTDEGATSRIATTFNALVKLADFSESRKVDFEESVEAAIDDEERVTPDSHSRTPKGLRPEFHYNFQIHLPANGSEETYLNIFNALRKTFQ